MKFLTSLAPRVLWTLLAASALLLAGCDLEGENDAGGAEAVTAGVYVANAGAFQGNNSSYTVYDPQRTTTELVDLSALGSYVQSLLVADSLAYVLMGETGAVEVFSAETNERIGRIEGIPNPRYMALAGPDKAYVTSQDYSGSPARVVAVDLSTNALTEIEVGGTPEGVAVAGGRAYVALGGFGSSGEVAVIDVAADAVAQTLDAECVGAREVVVDEQGELVVFCTGNTSDTTNGAIRVLDRATGQIIERIDLDVQIASASLGQSVFYAPAAEEAYATLADTTVLRFDTATNGVDVRLGPFEGDPIGAVGYDVRGERLYLGRFAGYATPADVTVHDRDGAEIGSFPAGIAPTFVDFRVSIDE